MTKPLIVASRAVSGCLRFPGAAWDSRLRPSAPTRLSGASSRCPEGESGGSKFHVAYGPSWRVAIDRHNGCSETTLVQRSCQAHAISSRDHGSRDQRSLQSGSQEQSDARVRDLKYVNSAVYSSLQRLALLVIDVPRSAHYPSFQRIHNTRHQMAIARTSAASHRRAVARMWTRRIATPTAMWRLLHE